MDNIKTKELELLQTLSKLDLFTDLVANSKKKIVDLESVKGDLENEKKQLMEKLSTLEDENKSLINQLSELQGKNLSASSNEDLKDSNIAATLLKVQERKTAKGNSYAVLKLTDLSSVFELFIFSDVLELNREILKEGSSLILTIFKNVSNDENRLTRINVQKIASLKDLFNSPINEVSFQLNSEEQIEKISTILNDEGKTIVNINLVTEDNILKFRLKNARKLERKSLNLLRNQEIQAIIN